MFNVIRIPTKFNKPISRLSDKDQLRLYKLIRDIWDWKSVIQTDDSVWDILSLIYSEWMNMEVRNGYKRESSHLSNPESSIEPCPSDSGHRVEYSIVEDNRVEDIPKGIWLQAIEDKPDNRNPWTQRIIDIIKSQVEKEGFLYDNNKEERNRATIIAKRQSDWWTFIKEESEEKEEFIIRSIISYSNQNEYTSKIRSAKDFHEKWKKVANTMKEAWKEAEKNLPNPNPLLRFTR